RARAGRGGRLRPDPPPGVADAPERSGRSAPPTVRRGPTRGLRLRRRRPGPVAGRRDPALPAGDAVRGGGEGPRGRGAKGPRDGRGGDWFGSLDPWAPGPLGPFPPRPPSAA